MCKWLGHGWGLLSYALSPYIDLICTKYMCINRAPTKLIINNINEAAASAPSRLSGGATTQARETETDVDSGINIRCFFSFFIQLRTTLNQLRSLALIHHFTSTYKLSVNTRDDEKKKNQIEEARCVRRRIRCKNICCHHDHHHRQRRCLSKILKTSNTVRSEIVQTFHAVALFVEQSKEIVCRCKPNLVYACGWFTVVEITVRFVRFIESIILSGHR